MVHYNAFARQNQPQSPQTVGFLQIQKVLPLLNPQVVHTIFFIYFRPRNERDVDMSTPHETPADPAMLAEKPRNPIERLLVWGGILVLLALVGIEYSARRTHSTAVDGLIAKLKKNEQAGSDVTTADVRAAVGGKSPRVEDVSANGLRNGARRVEIYSWFSLNPMSQRKMYVYYGIGEPPAVVSVSTTEETEKIAAATELDAIQKDDLKTLREGLEKGIEQTKDDPEHVKEYEVFQKALKTLDEDSKNSAADAEPPRRSPHRRGAGNSMR